MDVPLSGIVIFPVLQNVLPLTTVALSTRCDTVPLLVRKPVAPLYVARDQMGALGQRRRGQALRTPEPFSGTGSAEVAAVAV